MIILIDGKRKKIYGRCNKCYSIEIAQFGIIGKDKESVIISLVKCVIERAKNKPYTVWRKVGVNWRNRGGFVMKPPLHIFSFNTVLRPLGYEDPASTDAASPHRFPCGQH